MLFLKHANAKPVRCADYAAASAFYCAKRDKSGKGASQFPPALLYTGSGCLVAHISYNGRIWPGSPKDWKPGDAPAFDNR